MDKIKLAYRLLYISGVMLLLTSIFHEPWLVYTKTLVVISLSFFYLVAAKKIRYLVLIALMIVLISEVLSVIDFKKYFRVINVLMSFYYCFNMMLLWKSLKKVKIQLKRIFTIQLGITMSLITYVVYSVADMISLNVGDDQFYLNILIILFILFIGFCYYIYLNSKTVVSSSLMIAASCFLIVNILTILNKMYVYLDVFVVITNVLQLFGHYFLVKFFVEQEDLKPDDVEFF
ncbi:hypothetical protein J8L88_18230 [Aquimarina sp. MMG015]|uniref:hypothetical protein n=1 Tax=Aquimarina TaxID=290174 RepID=UPI00040E4653|nr:MULTISPECIES: hypothetical protein [Aquimarina]AXT54784.1 hypothetical protein D1815_03110 [Aquimarina sp. AD1]MBQ4804807.1 hypothetical protein [Aquimarina sp. MMG015]